MNCQELNSGTHWADLVLGELPSDVADEAARHIADCESCRQRLKLGRETLGLLRHLPKGPTVPDWIRFPAPPPEGHPPLSAELEARLLSIPWRTEQAEAGQIRDRSLDRHPLTSWFFRPALELSRLVRRRLELSRLARARWYWMGGAVAAALLLVVFYPPRDIIKGSDPGPSSERVHGTMRLELVAIDSAGGYRRLPLEALPGQRFGAAVSSGQALLPVIQSLDIDLSASVWFVTAIGVDAQRTLKACILSDTATPLEHLPQTESLYVVGREIRLPTQPDGSPRLWRLFVLFTQTPVTGEHLSQAVRALPSVGALEAMSLLQASPFLSIQGLEATMLVEVR